MTHLTSETHPLRIDAVATPGGGVIGMTFCPGKKQADSHTGHWFRDLAKDLKVIADWGATAVVTLMEPEELQRVEVPHIGEAVEVLGLDWYHLPVRDVQPPGQRFENRWVLYGLRLRRLLRGGGKVLLHCRGGLGRTGTVAARLLVELGMPPTEAIAAVRTARPGTIETAAQKAHVLATTVPVLDEALVDRALGCLLGGALGDGFGYAVEFDSLKTIRQRFGAAGLRTPAYQDGYLRVSDDTQMTLFTLEAMTRTSRNGSDEQLVDNLRHAYADWLQTQGAQRPGYLVQGTLAKRTALRHRRAPGNTCLSALQNGAWGSPVRPINQSKGCGAVMRVAPLGWFRRSAPYTTFHLGARAGALTHGHPDGWASAGMLAVLIGALFEGHSFSHALEQAKAVTAQALSKHQVNAELLAVVTRAQTRAKRLRSDPTRALAEIGQGWVGEEALAVATYAVLTADSFEDAIQRATNHDGDSDSTGSIAGQIWGAWKGVDALPMAWVRRLDVLAECLHGVGQLAQQGHRAAPTSVMRAVTLPPPEVQTCLDILEMVHLLHRRGYQRLRIAPGLAPSGCCWRVAVAPSDNFLATNGALLREFEQAAHHTTGNGPRPFDWRDAQGKGPRGLADLFLARFPELAHRGRGTDWAYAGWYLEVLGLAARGLFPIAYGDWYEEPDPRYLLLTGPGASTGAGLLAPPPVPAAAEAEVPMDPDAPEANGFCSLSPATWGAERPTQA
ncbi:ADP-ribosylglycohydrolase family protein [uncultured Thiodictyon sp.]|uniref:ADP-ribosylglycohydrolase family protein n=1 Tax=uncultured Thiodictyon sp. TaxID=1846217 RepID=UPI0025E6FA17|nr:ADP-ribosylglycohydrolase family protein [uncultured Thiodictyon sp.]